MSNQTKTRSEKNNKIAEIDEQILRTFEIKKRLGKGAYGIVWKATDKKTQQTVAVKKIFDAFRNETDAQRTFREIMFLRAFRNHPNIVQLYSIHRATNHMDIYLSFEFMESDLHNVIKRGSILKDIHKRFMMYQLLNATQYIHSGKVIHRDMKPSNVLVDSKCRCKIADFGLARSIAQHPTERGSSMLSTSDAPDEPCLTDYVATRWYRAPEILVASKKYTMGIDMWSLGCILGEMIRGKPLFPGSCTVNQIERIVSALPDITDNDIQSVGGGFGTALLSSKSTSMEKLDRLLAGSPNDARELVKSLLVLDPMKRLTARQALNHRYIERFRNTSPECELSADVVPPFRDDVQLTVSEYRSKLYEIMSSHEKNGYLAVKKSDNRDQHQLLQSTITVHPATQVANKSSHPILNPKVVPKPHHQHVSSSNINYKPNTSKTNTAQANQQQPQPNAPFKYPPKNGVASYANSFSRAASVSTASKTTKHLSSCTQLTLTQTDESRKVRSLIDPVSQTTVPYATDDSAVNQRPPPVVVHENRRLSLDNCSVGPPPIKLSRETQENRLQSDASNVRLVPSMSKHRLMSVLQSRTTKLSKQASTSTLFEPSNPSKTQVRTNMFCFKSNSPPSHQPPKTATSHSQSVHNNAGIRDESNYDARLRMLEEKVRVHNQNLRTADQQYKAVVRQRRHNPSQSDPSVIGGLSKSTGATHLPNRSFHPTRSRPADAPHSIALNHHNTTTPVTVARSTFHQVAAGMPQSVLPYNQVADIGAGGDNMLNRLPAHNRMPHNASAASGSGNYGVVRATDFYKPRTSELTS